MDDTKEVMYLEALEAVTGALLMTMLKLSKLGDEPTPEEEAMVKNAIAVAQLVAPKKLRLKLS